MTEQAMEKPTTLADLSPHEQRELLERTAFGRVLVELMEARGYSLTPETVMDLAEEAGVDPWKVANRTLSPENRWAGNFKRLAHKRELAAEERRRLKRALDYEEE